MIAPPLTAPYRQMLRIVIDGEIQSGASSLLFAFAHHWIARFQVVSNSLFRSIVPLTSSSRQFSTFFVEFQCFDSQALTKQAWKVEIANISIFSRARNLPVYESLFRVPSCLILVCDTTDEESPQKVEIRLVESRAFLPRPSMFMLVGTKCDDPTTKLHVREKLKDLAARKHVPYIETAVIPSQDLVKSDSFEHLSFTTVHAIEAINFAIHRLILEFKDSNLLTNEHSESKEDPIDCIWEWQDDHARYIPYDERVQAQLNEAANQGESVARVTVSGSQFDISLDSSFQNVQRNITTGTTRRIRRISPIHD